MRKRVRFGIKIEVKKLFLRVLLLLTFGNDNTTSVRLTSITGPRRSA